MARLHFTVLGTPAPQGSKKHVGRGIMVESSKRVAPWREDVRNAARDAIAQAGWETANGPVGVGLLFYLPRPGGHYGTGRNAGTLRASAPAYPAVKPDLDKLTRSTLDALTEAGAIRDDSRVVLLEARKRYATPGTIASGVVVDVQTFRTIRQETSK